MEEDVIIVKLPPHTTDLIQPLDVTCFGPMKRDWETMLNEHVNERGPNKPMKKPTFVDLISKIWHKNLSPTNVKAGFRKTGIYPPDRTQYPVKRFDPRLLRRYHQWIEMGKPEDLMEKLATAINTPTKAAKPNDLPQALADTSVESVNTSTLSEEFTVSTPIGVEDLTKECECQCKLSKLIGKKPCPVPGKICVPL